LAIRALLHLPGWRLLVCGEGRDRAWLERLAARLGLSDRVRFVGRVPRDRVLELMRDETDVLLFPSYHDEGGWVVSEAIACGVPVVCLDRGGPAALGGHAVQPSGSGTTACQLADMAQRVAGHQERGPVPDFDRQLARIRGILTDHGLIARLPDPL
jgi:glycosyltransferase involved in cell wall biosynthesis